MTSRKLNPYESSTFENSLLLRVDGAIGAMSLSPNGRRSFSRATRSFIIDLDDPFTPPRWLHHITSWEVADVQWSPHHFVKPSWCISTSNQKALLWDLKRPSSNAIASILHSHNRAISDINFHPFDPEILATCAVDSFIMSWDMRAQENQLQSGQNGELVQVRSNGITKTPTRLRCVTIVHFTFGTLEKVLYLLLKSKKLMRKDKWD